MAYKREDEMAKSFMIFATGMGMLITGERLKAQSPTMPAPQVTSLLAEGLRSGGFVLGFLAPIPVVHHAIYGD